MWPSTKGVRLPINTRRDRGMLHKQKTTWWARIVPLRLSLARCCQADASTRDVFRTNPLQDGRQSRHSLSHVAYHHSARFILVSFLLCIGVGNCIFLYFNLWKIACLIALLLLLLMSVFFVYQELYYSFECFVLFKKVLVVYIFIIS